MAESKLAALSMDFAVKVKVLPAGQVLILRCSFIRLAPRDIALRAVLEANIISLCGTAAK